MIKIHDFGVTEQKCGMMSVFMSPWDIIIFLLLISMKVLLAKNVEIIFMEYEYFIHMLSDPAITKVVANKIYAQGNIGSEWTLKK